MFDQGLNHARLRLRHVFGVRPSVKPRSLQDFEPLFLLFPVVHFVPLHLPVRME